MNEVKQFSRNRKGSTLLAVLGYTSLVTSLVATILVIGSSHRKVSQRQYDMERAVNIAEAGVERGARYIEVNLGSLGTTTTTNVSFGGGTYKYVITKVTPSTYSISSTGTVNSVSRSVTLRRIYQPTYAQYALWSHENGGLYFKAGEVFDGRVHADDQLWFSGDPVFHAAVTSGASSYGGSISSVQFDEGLELNSYQGTMADVDFNSSASTSLKSLATSSGLLLDGNTTITFNSGGTVKITNSRKGWTNQSYTPTAEGIIYIRDATSGTTSTRPGTAYLTGGTVKGRLTVVTETDMYIQGSILYKTNPRTTPSSTDALGLISRDDIYVDTIAPNNLEINAAMMATGTASASDRGSFSVINYNTGLPRGTLTLYGGIVQDLRGAVGTFNQSTGLTTTGFAKDYSYDSRFIDDPPPYYPDVAGKVEFADWQEGR